MRMLGGRVLLLTGALALGFGGMVAARGAEAPIPSGPGVIEGTVAASETVVSPVGEPFRYGLVRIDDARSAGGQSRSAYWAEAIGDSRVRIETPEGIEERRVNPPDDWYRVEGPIESREVSSLSGLPVVGDLDVGDRLQPPFRISALVLREGDRAIIDAEGRVYVGDRATLEAEHSRREQLRWPVVAMLMTLGLVSILASVALLRSSKPGES